MIKENFRNLMESMTEAFEPSMVSNGFLADIQFLVSGEEQGNYYYHIGNGKCTFHEGIAESPKITIQTPSEVWRALLNGELDAKRAFFEQKFTVEGDLMLMLSLVNMFKPR